MSWSRALDLFINFGQTPDYVLLRSLADMGPADRPVLVGGDRFLFRLWLVQPAVGGGAGSLLQLSADAQIVIGGRTNLASPTLLFAATGFAAVTSGDGLHYEAEVNLNTVEIPAALGTEIAILSLVEVQIQSPDNSERSTKQFSARINRGGFAALLSPTPADPSYPLPGALLTTGLDTSAIKRGSSQPAAGDVQAAFVFATAFTSAPRTVFAWITRRTGKDSILCDVPIDTITPQGFTAAFGAAIPAGSVLGDYRVSFIAIV